MEALPQIQANPISVPTPVRPENTPAAASVTEPAGRTLALCAACGSVLQGPFCHACGQKALDSSHFTIRYLVGEFLKEFTSFDGKLWSTIRLMLLRPGQLVVDYLEGRGRLHVSPVKLYLVATAIYFVLFPHVMLNIPDLEQFAGQVPSPTLEPLFQKMRDGMASGAFYTAYQNWYTLLLACTVAINTLVLKMAFRHRVLGEHLVFSLNELTFVFLLVLPLAVVRPFIPGWQATGAAFTLVLVLAWVVYVTVAIRRVYQPSRWKLVLFMMGYLFFRQTLDATVAMAAIILAAL